MSKYTGEIDRASRDAFINDVQNIFDKVNGATTAMAAINHNNVSGIRDLCIKFSVLYSLCRSKYAEIASLKKNREVAHFVKLQEESCKTGEKFVVGQGEKLASLFVAEERELRNMLEAKMDVCIESIRTLRLLISSFVPVREGDIGV